MTIIGALIIVALLSIFLTKEEDDYFYSVMLFCYVVTFCTRFITKSWHHNQFKNEAVQAMMKMIPQLPITEAICKIGKQDWVWANEPNDPDGIVDTTIKSITTTIEGNINVDIIPFIFVEKIRFIR